MKTRATRGRSEGPRIPVSGLSEQAPPRPIRLRRIDARRRAADRQKSRPGGPRRTSGDGTGAPSGYRQRIKNRPRGGPTDAPRGRRIKFRRYLLSRFWHYHRLWKLNYRVRDGNGCDLPDMVTGNIVSSPRSGNEIWVVVIGMRSEERAHALLVSPAKAGDSTRKHLIRVVKHSSVSTG